MADDCCHHDHGHHAQPHALQELSAAQATAAGIRTPMRIMQMDCPTEETLIRKKLQGMPQVHDVEFNLMQRVLTVQHTANGLDAVIAALNSLGFHPELPEEGQQLDVAGEHVHPVKPWWPLAVAAFLALAAEILHWIQAPAWAGLGLAAAAIAISGTATYKKGLVAITNRNLNINALMSIAVTGAVLLGQWPEAAMVMVLFAISEAIEARSLDRARLSVETLMNVAPQTVALQQADGTWADTPVKSVAVNSVVRVRPGERIGLDGVVTTGQSEINQAPITGESALQPKGPGDSVYAGSINGMGELDYRVSAVADDTMLARIIHAVHDAQARKAPTQRFVDRFAQVYTPIVCLLALAVAVFPPLVLGASWYDWIYRALVLLVIACPCALVISTPVAVVSALGAAARSGILVKGGVYLEQGRRLKWLALDKTGTLTSGRPQLLDTVWLQDDTDAMHAHAVAAALASRSDHPVSRAIARGLPHAESMRALEVQQFQAVAGGGTQATIDGQAYYLGNAAWMRREIPGADTTAHDGTIAALQEQGKTVTVLADDTQWLALFVVADALRDSARTAIRNLHDLGVRTLMLSGDNTATARYVGQQAGIDEIRGDLLPDDKLVIVEELTARGMTGMVGDGINDAPALARADIGFAMGAMGTDTAIETADVALMDDDLNKVSSFIRLSGRTHRILVQNISFALGVKALFLVITLVGLATMWMAVFADVGASLIVLANSLRLLRS